MVSLGVVTSTAQILFNVTSASPDFAGHNRNAAGVLVAPAASPANDLLASAPATNRGCEKNTVSFGAISSGCGSD